MDLTIVPSSAAFANMILVVDGLPLSNPIGQIFRINPDNGSVALDFQMGNSGIIEFSPSVIGPSYFEGVLDLSDAVYDNYVISVSYTTILDTYNVPLKLYIQSPSTSSDISSPQSSAKFNSFVTP